MIKVIVMYKQPEDVDAFMKYYEEKHMPLAQTIPGLSGAVVNKVFASPTSKTPEYFLVTELHFPDKDTFKKAMASEENRATGEDVKNFAPDGATILIAEC